jgi:hypothetical protein
MGGRFRSYAPQLVPTAADTDSDAQGPPQRLPARRGRWRLMRRMPALDRPNRVGMRGHLGSRRSALLASFGLQARPRAASTLCARDDSPAENKMRARKFLPASLLVAESIALLWDACEAHAPMGAKEGKTAQFALRIEPATLHRVASIAQKLQARSPVDTAPTRAEVIRTALARGLSGIEDDLNERRPRSKPTQRKRGGAPGGGP